MKLVALWLVAGSVLFVADMIVIPRLILPAFEADVGGLLRADPWLGAALVFYLMYPAGLVAYVARPALAAGRSLGATCLAGIGFGAVAYGTFEFTSLAILEGWTWRLALLDTAWGGAVSGAASAAAVGLVRAVPRLRGV